MYPKQKKKNLPLFFLLEVKPLYLLVKHEGELNKGIRVFPECPEKQIISRFIDLDLPKFPQKESDRSSSPIELYNEYTYFKIHEAIKDEVNQLISEKKKCPKCHNRMNHLTRHLWEAAASQLYVPSVREK